MSTILRIGSLMKVGFGSAGVEIIRNSLEPGQSKNMLILDSKGSTVSCIFLFCDIRQFTDATECLQEEVFVFTNKIAAVVHSICHAYGGSANKNIGDAFLLSWLLEDETAKPDSRGRSRSSSNQVSFGSGPNNSDTFTAKTNQADKALLSVVKICMALHHDKFYIEAMSETARDALLTKLSKRKGPVVQMGFGLHAGKAVQGAIGSQRKIDATYVSESVERAEFLESSTKKYGLNMLMSDSFHRLLHPSNRRRCRKIDQILLQNDEDDDEEAGYDEGDVMELFTFDMDIDALWRTASKKSTDNADSASESDSINESAKGSKREVMEKKASSARHVPVSLLKGPRRRSMNRLKPNATGDTSSDEFTPSNSAAEAATIVAASVVAGSTEFGHDEGNRQMPPELILPTGPTLYNANVWLSEDMRKIRELFSDGLFFQKFNSGLQSYYARDWEHAKQCFQTILERFTDGPSRYFLKCIEVDNNGVPPRHFPGYGTA
jgi:class 3 adenylate cyclase